MQQPHISVHTEAGQSIYIGCREVNFFDASNPDKKQTRRYVAMSALSGTEMTIGEAQMLGHALIAMATIKQGD